MNKRYVLASFLLIFSVLFSAVLPPTTAEAVSTSRCRSTYLVKYQTQNTCSRYAKQLLIERGYLPVGADLNSSFGEQAVNATLNFQRAQGIDDDGIIGKITWGRLINPKSVSTTLPSACKTTGIVLCASQAQRKLFYMKSGKIVKTIDIRFGGLARELNGSLRLKKTTKGTHSITQKDADYVSKAYNADMPYALRFYRGEFFHYSSNFARYGYDRASHGCINIGSLSEAKWLYENTPMRTKVVVY